MMSRPSPWPTVALLAVGIALVLASPPALHAQAGNGWVGKRVVQRYPGFRLQIENRVINPKTVEIYHVEQVNGPWLWLRDERRGGSGWASADQVVPVEQAIAFFTEYIRANPGDSHGYTMRALIWRDEKKEYDIALGDLNEAIRLDPGRAYVWNWRGAAWQFKKEYDRAIADYSEAICLDPGFDYSYNNRAWLWATCPDARYRDGKRAVESATRACELSEWKTADLIDTLAASYAEAGDFDAAVKWQSRAIELLSDEKVKDVYRTRLKLYREKKPYRQTDS
jgi:hypothetical protein